MRKVERSFRLLRRKLILSHLPPRVLRHPRPFAGPVLIVGSAPVSRLPRDLDSRFWLITINGSQSVTTAWGLGPPDVTFLQPNNVEGMTDNALAVRSVLQDQGTRLLYVLRWKRGMARLRRGLASFNYQYDE